MPTKQYKMVCSDTVILLYIEEEQQANQTLAKEECIRNIHYTAKN